MKNKNNSIAHITGDIGALLLGGALFAVAYNMFFLPGKIFIGGVGGIAEVLNILFGLPTGIMIILINIPLALLFCFFYGFKSGLKSMISVILTSLPIDIAAAAGILPSAFPSPENNAFLCAVFGGLILGAAIGLLLYRGYTTGGSDFAAYLIKLIFPNISTAKLIALVDFVVIIFAAVVMRDWLSVLYSILAVCISSMTIEAVTGGFERAKIAYIFSEKNDEIAEQISKKLKRGVTFFDGEGWYTGVKKKVIFCVVKKREMYLLKTIAKGIDGHCFIVLGDASETIGEGFKTNLGDNAFVPEKEKKNKNNKV